MSCGKHPLEPEWIHSFITVLGLCKVTSQEGIVVLVESGSRQLLLDSAAAALSEMGLAFEWLFLPGPGSVQGPIVKSSGASLLLNNHPDAVRKLAASDFILDMSVEGLMHARETASILKGGARILNISNEHPETLARLVPQLSDKRLVRQAVSDCRSARTMQVQSEAGSDLKVDMQDAATVGIWGFTDRPGTLAHWPGGLVVSFPAKGSCRGRLMLDIGDMNLTFKRYLESPVSLLIEDDYVVQVEGTGLDARLMRNYLEGFDDPAAYAVSHVGWGLNPRARYEALTMYDKADTNGTELRALAGNFLFSTGANEFAGRFTRGHFDLPMMNCDVLLDGVAVVDQGRLVARPD